MRTATIVSAWITATLVLGCSGGSKESGDLIHKDGGETAADTGNPATSFFKIYEVPECGLAGYQTVAAMGAGTVAFATLAATPTTSPCTIEGRAQSAPNYDLFVVQPSATGFVGSVATTLSYDTLRGVGIVIDKAGTPVLAYTGGDSAARHCGASDMVISSVIGGKAAAPQTIATGSVSTGMPADQAISCAAQNVCNQGDATGYWPSIALDPVSGQLGVAFRDMHYGAGADTDTASSDVEFALGPGYSVYTVDVARGGGTYNRLAFSPTGMAAVVHYVETKPTIWLDWQTAEGWKSQKLFDKKIGEQLGFGISAQGLYALAYFDLNRQALAYRQSVDGTTWTPAEDVDHDAITGNYPSLAFDSQGNPAISYYRCNDYGTTGGCSTEKDGLYLARRLNGVWITRKISADSGINDGMYTALAFLDGKAVIAFQTSYFDPVAGTSKVGLSVAKEM